MSTAETTVERVYEAGFCMQCGTCLEVCPGEGFDFTGSVWWRERNADSR